MYAYFLQNHIKHIDTIRDDVLVKNIPISRMQDVGPGSYAHKDEMTPSSFNIKTSEVFQVIMNESMRINRAINRSQTRDRSSSKNRFNNQDESP
jgi:hypothetical protein